MSSLAVTTAGTASCAHQGTVALSASRSLLKVSGAAVLVVDDAVGAGISSCVTVDDTSKGLVQCRKTTALTAGTSLLLRIGGRPALLDSAAGTTSGVTAPPAFGTFSVSAAGQNLLETT